MRARYLLLGIIAAALVAGGLYMALRHGFSAPESSLPPANATSTAPTGVASAPRVTDVPTPPGDVASKVADKGVDSLTAKERAAWDAYLKETAAVVSKNADAFRTTLDSAIDAIVAGDTAALSASFAPDEDVSAAFVDALASTYPRIEDRTTQPTVGIFAVGKATVYFGYAVVRWEDGGIVSEHTIAVPMRFVGGRWYLTSIGSGTTGLTAVQSVLLKT